jgi:hypothetical protein
MNQTHIASTDLRDSRAAGAHLGHTIREAFGGAAADAVLVFASAEHDYDALLQSLAEAAGTEVIAGSSSAGEFTDQGSGVGQVSALGLRGPELGFSVGLGRGVSASPAEAARQAVAGFRGLGDGRPAHRTALVMVDALAGHTDALVEELTMRTGGDYRFFGGGAGDDGRFATTHVFAGTRSYTDAVCALEILSDKPVGIGVAHGWRPASEGMRVTEADGERLIGLNGGPALEAIEAHARQTGQPFDAADPLPFFLHNVLGIEGIDGHRLRVPLAVTDDGALVCAAAVPEGAVVHVMTTSAASAAQAAREATEAALRGLAGHKPGAAVVFDCVATRLRLGRAFEDELQACARLLEPAGFVGCNTYGQIARAEGQFNGFHNCTAVVCILPA